MYREIEQREYPAYGPLRTPRGLTRMAHDPRTIQTCAQLIFDGFLRYDENFVRVAYNFEREFSDRWRRCGGTIRFVPAAAIRHLKVASGGTRTFGDHLRTLLPAHTVGNYYYLLRSKDAPRRAKEFLGRPLRSISTRHHLRRPWWIPVTLVAELSGMAWALMLNARGPRYCSGRSRTGCPR